MAGIKISLVEDVGDFLRGMGRAEDALSGVSDSLDDLAADAQRDAELARRALDREFTGAADGVQDSVRDMTRGLGQLPDAARREGNRSADDIGDSTRKMERSFKDMVDAVKRDTSDMGTDLGRNVRRGTDDAEEGLRDFRSEAGSTARETAASFDGSADSIVDALQEAAANAFGGFGPAAAIAGTAAALGIGAMWEAWNAQQEAAEERISGLADAMIEANGRVVAESFITDQLKAIYTGAEDAAIGVDDLRRAAEETGVTEAELARAFAGDQDARVAALERVESAYLEAADKVVNTEGQAKLIAQERQAELGRWLSELQLLGGEYDTAASRAQSYADAVAAGEQGNREQVGHTMEEYQNLQRTIENLPASKSISLTVDLDEADRVLRQWRPVVVGQVRVNGQAVV